MMICFCFRFGRFLSCCLILICCQLSPDTFAQVLASSINDAPTRTLNDYIDQYLGSASANTTDWRLFAKTKMKDVEGVDNEGFNYQYYLPSFSPELKALDGKNITLKGFMFPLDEKERQVLFLFGPFPLNCPFQYHVTPALVVEVHAQKSIAFSYDPIIISGQLQLVDKDEENNTFYRLLHVIEVK